MPDAPTGLEPEPFESSTPRRPLLLIATAVAVIVAVVAVAMAMALRADNRDLRADAADRRQVASTAATVVEALFTFDHRDLDSAAARIAALTTGQLAAEYETAFTGDIRASLLESEARGVATVTDVFVEDIDGASAKAVVVMDLVVDSTEGRRQTFDNHLVVSLVRLVDGWAADGVQTLSAGIDPRLLDALDGVSADDSP